MQSKLTQFVTRAISGDEKGENVTPVSEKGKKEDLDNYKLFSFTLIPGKVMEHIYVEAFPSLMKNKKMVENSWK